MIVFIITILTGIWILYNFATAVIQTLPFLDLYHGGNAIIETLNIIALRWSLPAGLFVTISGVLGLVFHKSSSGFANVKYPALIIGILFSIAVVL